MNTAQSLYGSSVYDAILRVFGVIADSMGGAEARAWPAVTSQAPKTACASAVGRSKQPGVLGRIGERLWRRQLKSVDVYVAKSDDIFANLDRWLWKQHMRETEAWLAQSRDVYELEARIRHLERNRDGHVL